MLLMCAFRKYESYSTYEGKVEMLTMFASHVQPHSLEFSHSHKAYIGW